MTALDLSFVDRTIATLGRGREQVIPLLQAIQGHYRYLPREALQRVCAHTDITPSLITGVSTFYSQFRHEPMGRHTIQVCHGTACHVKGSRPLQDALEQHLGLNGNRDTDARGLFTVQKVACLGCCTLAPVVQIDDVTYGYVTPDVVPKVLKDFLEFKKHAARMRTPPPPPPPDSAGEIRISLDSCCIARGCGNVNAALERALRDLGLRITLKHVGCVGMCDQTPLLEIISPEGASFLYARVKPEDAKALVLRHFTPPSLVRRAVAGFSAALERVLTDAAWEPVTRYAVDTRDPPIRAFLDRQKNIATEHFGVLDPLDFEEYRRGEGFTALARCLDTLSPEQIIETIMDSGLRGRGGAGFPTGEKWRQVRRAPGDVKTVVCNGDEGDPGAFMDRMILESYPFRVIEGMAIAARAVGARTGYLYIRAEYPLAVQRVRAALERCRREGLLGEGILGTEFALELRIMEGAGAFVCGEETALIASIEGRRGIPRLRPPYPAQSGLWGKPTLVNNVETYALVPWIIRNGAAAFRALGTDMSAGTKVFALAGKVARGALIEVPMGITLREIVQDIGGGMPGGRTFKAVQVGGPSGGCVPASLADTQVDFEALAGAGAIMGSGGLVVLDDRDCMVDIARYFLEFTQDQSCGTCTFCRIGTRRMLDILERLCGGQGVAHDLEDLERLAHMVKKGSLCGLGKTAPNPVLTTLRYFRDEYEAHIAGRCPAGKCKALIRYVIGESCIGCTLCAQKCPTNAIAMMPHERHVIDDALCVRCGTCQGVCPIDAITVQ